MQDKRSRQETEKFDVADSSMSASVSNLAISDRGGATKSFCRVTE